MTDTINVTDLIGAIKSANAEREAQAHLQLEREQKAAQLKAEAEQAEADAAAIANTTRAGSGDLLRLLRTLTSEVHQARLDAITAVREGQDPSAAWTRYRLLRARNYGKWQAYSTLFSQLSGNRRPPPGAWGPVMINLPNQWDNHMGGEAEGFVDFLHHAVGQAEPDQISLGMAEAWEVIEQAERKPDDAAADDEPNDLIKQADQAMPDGAA